MDVFGFGKMTKLSGHKNKSAGWPPHSGASWGPLLGSSLSWDMGSLREGRDYFSNVSQSSSLEEVRVGGLQLLPPAPRLLEMRRDPVLGFGFVAGSEKPVVVRSVTPGGPSEGKLIPGDEIIMINEEAVSSAPRERVIDLVRNCKESIMLTVIQPYPSPKSAFISAAKKAQLKSNPVKVRFAEEVIVNGQVPNSVKDNSLLFMPNVLKVYLENGQTKSFRFDHSTSIKDVILTLQEKLSIKCIEHFSLMLEQRAEGSASKLLLLHEQEMLTQVTQRPGSDKMKCFFRISFVPKDPVDLLRRDAVAFEYLYVQTCNDVVLERFGPELKYDAALRLAALQMYIVTVTTRLTQKVSLKYIQKEWGLALFLPAAVMSTMKEKNIKKALTHILKTNQNLVPPGRKLTALQAKVHYVRYLSDMRLYGGREFKSILLQGEKQTEVILLVGPRYGISHVINTQTHLVALLADFSHVNRIEILTEDDTNVRLELHVLDVRPITLIMDSSDAMNLACLTAGYYRLLVDSRRSIFNMVHSNSTTGDDIGQDRLLEWPYSTALGDSEDPDVAAEALEPYNQDSGYANNTSQENNFSRCVPDPPQHPPPTTEGRTTPPPPLPPPLPPATRLKPQDSPRSAKVSFIFGDPPLNTINPQKLGYERLLDESPEAPERPPAFHHANNNNTAGFRTPEGAAFQYTGRPHVVYSNIGAPDGVEEPLLRDLCYADTTDDAEDEDDASCEEDSSGAAGGGEGGAAAGGGATAASKATFLALSGSTDDIIDLTSLPPPEGDEDEEDDDALLHSLNLAIAAPPPGFRDSSDEETTPEGRPLSTPDNDDIPVSLIDAVPAGGEGSGERALDDAVVDTLQALEALAVSENRPCPRPNSAPGVSISRAFSPESSSDSGNETNSSEMTEMSEQAALHKLSESSMRMLVATREGFQQMLEEKTEFPASPGMAATASKKKPHSPSRQRVGGPPSTAAPPRLSPQVDAIPEGPDSADPQIHLRQRPSSVVGSGKRPKKSSDSNGKYNTFSTREAHRGGSGRLDSDHVAFCERVQRRAPPPLPENAVVETPGSNIPRGHRSLPRPLPPSSEHAVPEELNVPTGDHGAVAQEEQRLTPPPSPSPTKNRDPSGAELVAEPRPPSRPGVSRLCEYHLAKRISSMHGDVHGDAHSSLCSSLDAGGGGSVAGSACATPTDSPHCIPGTAKLSSSSSSLMRMLSYEDKPPHGLGGQNAQGRDLHPHADPALLRKMLPNIHPPGAEPGSSLRNPKMKETTGTARRGNLHNDLHAKPACLRGVNQKEGGVAYRQLINYLTVSQMHQGGQLHGAGMGGSAKKDSRCFITSNPQLVEMVRNKGNTVARCPCMPPSSSSPFCSPNLVNPNPSMAAQQVASPLQMYHSATLPTKLKRSPELHAQRPARGVHARHASRERRSSFSGLESELEPGAEDPERCPSLGKRDGLREGDGVGRSAPPRATPPAEDWPRSDCRAKHVVRQAHNNSVCFSTAPSVAHTEPLGTPLGAGDHPSAFTRQAKASATAAANLAHPPPPPPPPPTQVAMSSGNCVVPKQEITVQYRQNHAQAAMPTFRQGECGSLGLQRGRELSRSSSSVTAASVEALLLDKTRARNQQQAPAQQSESKVQRRPTRKRLSKSYSQGSVASHAMCWSAGDPDDRRASVAFPVHKDSKHLKGPQKLDTSPWRCNGPFSYCFFKRKSQAEEEEAEAEAEGARFRRGPAEESAAPPHCGAVPDAEQLYGDAIHNMSFNDRLARINALKDRMYVHPGGFAEVQRDAGELIALVRSSVGRGDGGVQMAQIQDLTQYKQLLSVESKELGRACRRMSQAHGSPEEMLLAVTCSFQVLCCLSEACMCLVGGLGPGAAQQQREVAAKVDEVVMNYICLLRAAEAASVGAPGEHSVKALVRHSSTMAAIANTLTRSLKMLLSK